MTSDNILDRDRATLEEAQSVFRTVQHQYFPDKTQGFIKDWNCLFCGLHEGDQVHGPKDQELEVLREALRLRNLQVATLRAVLARISLDCAQQSEYRTHWDGCEAEHPFCRIGRLAENALAKIKEAP